MSTAVCIAVLFTAAIAMTFGLPLFCWLARFLGWPWRRRARS